MENSRFGNVLRIDGAEILSGAAGYAADLIPTDALHVALLRSPHRKARILAIDHASARKAPGVVAVFTWQELAPHLATFAQRGPLLTPGPIQSHCLAPSEVCFVGHPVAAIVGVTARDAASALRYIQVTYETCEPVCDGLDALLPGAPIAHPGWSTNLVARDQIKWGDPEKAFAEAFKVVEGGLEFGIASAAPMETLCYFGDWRERENRLTLTGTFQNPHSSRLMIADAMRLPIERVRVIAARMGGSFGFKMFGHSEELLVGILSRLLRRPVAFVESRSENLAMDPSRKQRHRYRVALSEAGAVLAFRDEFVADMGIIGAGFGWSMPLVTAATFPTVYRIESGEIVARLAATNAPPWWPIRGYGKEVTNAVMERAMDHAADELGMDPVALRRRNLLAKNELPRRMPSRLNIDSGDYATALDELLTLFDRDAWRERQKAVAGGEKTIGIGLAFELTPEGSTRPGVYGGLYETATVRLLSWGMVEVTCGVTSQGTGNETGIAQIVSGIFGLPASRVQVIQGDTERTPVGMGSSSSKALIYGGMAAALAALAVREKLLRCAAYLFGSEAGEVRIEAGAACLVRDPARRISIDEIAAATHYRADLVAAGLDLPLEATRSYHPSNVELTPDASGRIASYSSFPYAVHAAAIELDRLIGVVKILDYAVVHDCGTVVNPTLVTSQLKGAVAFGIGAALWEEVTYDRQGRTAHNRFKSYLLPRSKDLPSFRVGHLCTPSPFHPLGMKGAGESGVSGSLAVITGAVYDAMRPFGRRLEHIPATPWRILQAMAGT
jgi:aerobic carbon-monoxide dehydrogenase large subunit